jgi:quinol monooxygenase YgiN
MTTTPVHVFARWKVKEGNLQTVLDLLLDLRAETILEKGNLFYKMHQSHADDHTLILFEGYADEAAQQAHTKAAHFKKLAVEQIIPLLEEREVILLTPIFP